MAVRLIAVLHVGQPGRDGEDATLQAVARYWELRPAGSYLAISRAIGDGLPEDVKKAQDAFWKLSNAGFRNGVIFRWTHEWHPEDTGANSPTITFSRPAESTIWAGVGIHRDGASSVSVPPKPRRVGARRRG